MMLILQGGGTDPLLEGELLTLEKEERRGEQTKPEVEKWDKDAWIGMV